MAATCLFCDRDVTNDYLSFGDHYEPNRTTYICSRCGIVRLGRAAADDFPNCKFSNKEKNAISITLRNEWERGGRNPELNKKFMYLDDLRRIADQFRPLNPLEKMNQALMKINKHTKFMGATVEVIESLDYPYYYSSEHEELTAILNMLLSDGLISQDVRSLMGYEYSITPSGYRRLHEIQRPNHESNQCFVAMWFADEVKKAYDNAIKPAIEYKEPGETEPRFKAVKIDNVEHVNDINDEIIAQIRRSRFMVCDLTGYRGGVYFEAGFAYGLGIPVIYTCRDDWTNAETLVDENGKEIRELYDKSGNQIRVGKEGVHFDLAHRNRIQWNPDDLDDFRTKLENRIKAVIY